jgi:hypothetical protein
MCVCVCVSEVLASLTSVKIVTCLRRITLPLAAVRLCHIFKHYLTNGTTFGKKELTEHKMCIVIFTATFVCNISHSKKNSARYCHNVQYRSAYRVSLIFVRF